MPRQRSNIKDFSFLHREQVRWGDMDSMGHVNNAVYFRYSESARIAFLDQLFGDDPAFMAKFGPILANISCDYHDQLHYPAPLRVGVAIERVGTSSLTLRCPVFREGEELAVADTVAVIVWFDYTAQTTVPIPQSLRDLMQTQ